MTEETRKLRAVRTTKSIGPAQARLQSLPGSDSLQSGGQTEKPLRGKSLLEEALCLYLKSRNIAFEREYYFFPGRRWRFDFAFVDRKIAIEIEGGIFVGGGHNRGVKYTGNCEKYNAAMLKGWKLIRFTTKHFVTRRGLKLPGEYIQAMIQEALVA